MLLGGQDAIETVAFQKVPQPFAAAEVDGSQPGQRAKDGRIADDERFGNRQRQHAVVCQFPLIRLQNRLDVVKAVLAEETGVADNRVLPARLAQGKSLRPFRVAGRGAANQGPNRLPAQVARAAANPARAQAIPGRWNRAQGMGSERPPSLMRISAERGSACDRICFALSGSPGAGNSKLP